MRLFTFTAAIALLFLPAREAHALLFSNVTTEVGITHEFTMPTVFTETSWIVGGAVAEDFDGDGLIDLYSLQGGTGTNHLYLNNGDGTFTNATGLRGLNLSADFSGAAAADYDNDGDIDICLTRIGAAPLLLTNNGTGFFGEVADAITNPTINVMSPSWGDIDNNGYLDLAVGQWNQNAENFYLYTNSGADTLHQHTLTSSPVQKLVFAPRFADIDNDGLQDLLVVSDFESSHLYHNLGTGQFVRITTSAGTGSDENGMGNAVGDYDNDGNLDWFVSSIRDTNGAPEGSWGVTGNRLFRNNGNLTFSNATTEANVRDGNWGWGSAFGDLDNDGDLDLFHVNGWPETVVATIPPKFNSQPARLFENQNDGSFAEVATASGADDTGQGRGVILFDYDDDGDLDIYIVNNQILDTSSGTSRTSAPPTLLRNDTAGSGHWLKTTLVATPPLHRHGIGSRVYVVSDDSTQMRELNASSGFLAHGPDRIAHVGLGTNTNVTVRAEWVNGDKAIAFNVGVDQSIAITNPTATLSKRTYLAGEEVAADGSGVGPVGNNREWVINGQTNADPLSVSFTTSGIKTLRLNIYAADGITLLRSEFMQISVFDVMIRDAVFAVTNDTAFLQWDAASGNTYRVEFDELPFNQQWTNDGTTYDVFTTGLFSTSMSNITPRIIRVLQVN